jgi:hypothetical protein
MAGWYVISCSDCQGEVRVHEDWSNPPSICGSCKEVRKNQWYDKSCESCSAIIRVNKEWSNPPRYCASCKDAQKAKWYDKPCEGCGGTIHANRDWDHPPVFCKPCKNAHPPQYKSCSHCGNTFTIPTGTLINCAKQGWDPPNRCKDCRELFKFKPFKTVRETDFLNNVVWRTYNSRGQFISESRDASSGLPGDNYREHRSASGQVIGRTRDREGIIGGHYRETRGADGGVKSTSRDREGVFGDHYSESTGGSSNTTHQTRSHDNLLDGKKHRETW